MKQLLRGSWQTTLAGTLTLIAVAAKNLAGAFDDDPETVFDLNALIEAIIAGVIGLGFIAARDNNKSSEAVRLKQSPGEPT